MVIWVVQLSCFMQRSDCSYRPFFWIVLGFKDFVKKSDEERAYTDWHLFSISLIIKSCPVALLVFNSLMVLQISSLVVGVSRVESLFSHFFFWGYRLLVFYLDQFACYDKVLKNVQPKSLHILGWGLLMLLWILWFFTGVPWGIFPSTNLVNCADNCYMSLVFYFFPFFLFFFTLKCKKLSLMFYYYSICSLSIIHHLLESSI